MLFSYLTVSQYLILAIKNQNEKIIKNALPTSVGSRECQIVEWDIPVLLLLPNTLWTQIDETNYCDLSRKLPQFQVKNYKKKSYNQPLDTQYCIFCKQVGGFISTNLLSNRFPI